MPIKYVKYHEVKVGVTYKFIDKETGEYRYITAVTKPYEHSYIGFHCCHTPIQSQSVYKALPKNLYVCGYMCSEDYFNNLGVTVIGDPIMETLTPKDLKEGIVYRVLNPVFSEYVVASSDNTTRYYQKSVGWRVYAMNVVNFLSRANGSEPALLVEADVYPSLPEELK